MPAEGGVLLGEGTESMADIAFLKPRSGSRLRLIASAKAVAYLAIAFVGALLVSALAKALTGASLLELAQGGATAGAVRALLLLAGVVVLPNALMLKLCKEPLRSTGWALDSVTRLAGWGLATGFALLTAIASVMWICGAVTFDIAVPTVSAASRGLMISTVLWAVQAAGEEGLNRGYAFVQLCQAISFWPAAICGSAWFTYGHIGNEGETALGIVVAGLFGLALSFSLLKTGSLWFALGFHASWNFSQSFVFGFHNSGGKPPTSVLHATAHGSPWLTGAAAGPEGSVLVLPALIAFCIVIQWVAVTICDRPKSAARSHSRIP